MTDAITQQLRFSSEDKSTGTDKIEPETSNDRRRLDRKKMREKKRRLEFNNLYDEVSGCIWGVSALRYVQLKDVVIKIKPKLTKTASLPAYLADSLSKTEIVEKALELIETLASENKSLQLVSVCLSSRQSF